MTEQTEMKETKVVPMKEPWDPVMLSLVVDKKTGFMSFSQQGLRNKDDVRMLIYGINRASELATDLLLTIASNEEKQEPQKDEQET